MKRFLCFITLLLSTHALAWTIGPMNYQGRLLDNNGIPLTGSYNFNVRIYDALTGGTLKFSELQNNIAVADGVYSFLVSTGTSPTGTWDINLWNTPSLYLEIAVNGQTLTPRHLLASTPFAFQANLALTTNNALALGGKSAGNVLKDICASGKGKWLDLAQKCLGIASSFPGPTRVLWSTLSTDSNFGGLDLSKADISGIDFTGANLGASIFTETTYSAQGIAGAFLSGTRWKSAVATDAAPVSFMDVELEDMHIQNMNLSKWNLSGAQVLSGFSASDLTACPTGMPNGWSCKANFGSYGGFYLIGPGVDLSTNSVNVLAYDNSIDSRINLNGLDLSGANLGGDWITQAFTNTSLNGSQMYKCHMTSPQFEATIDGAYMHSCKIEKTIFTKPNLSVLFDEARFEYVQFNGNVTNTSFRGATLVNVVFSGLTNNVDFTNAILDHVTFNGGSGNVTTGARLFGGSQMPPP